MRAILFMTFSFYFSSLVWTKPLDLTQRRNIKTLPLANHALADGPPLSPESTVTIVPSSIVDLSSWSTTTTCLNSSTSSANPDMTFSSEQSSTVKLPPIFTSQAEGGQSTTLGSSLSLTSFNSWSGEGSGASATASPDSPWSASSDSSQSSVIVVTTWSTLTVTTWSSGSESTSVNSYTSTQSPSSSIVTVTTVAPSTFINSFTSALSGPSQSSSSHVPSGSLQNPSVGVPSSPGGTLSGAASSSSFFSSPSQNSSLVSASWSSSFTDSSSLGSIPLGSSSSSMQSQGTTTGESASVTSFSSAMVSSSLEFQSTSLSVSSGNISSSTSLLSPTGSDSIVQSTWSDTGTASPTSQSSSSESDSGIDQSISSTPTASSSPSSPAAAELSINGTIITLNPTSTATVTIQGETIILRPDGVLQVGTLTVAVPAAITTLSAENGLPIVFNPAPTNTQAQPSPNSAVNSVLLPTTPGTTTLVIDHTIFTASQGLQTLTQDSTHTVVFGPSGIVLGTTATIVLPPVASPTTITSGGVEIPVMPNQSTSVPTSQFIDVPQPSSAPRSQVTVNGVVYPLPLEDEKGAEILRIPQPSGPPIHFGAKQLIIGTQTVTIPSGSQSTTVAGAGMSFGFGPALCRGTGGGGGGGGNAGSGGNGGKGGKGFLGGLFHAIGDVVGGAAAGLTGAATAGVGLVGKTGTELGSDFAKNIAPLIDDVANKALSVAPLIDGIASDLEKNALGDLTKLPVFQNARNIIGTAENIASGLKNIKGDMTSGDEAKINQHKDFLGQSFGTGGSPGQIQKAAKALDDFASHDWEGDSTQTTNSGNPTTTMQSTSKSSEPSSSSALSTSSSSDTQVSIRFSSISSSSTLVPTSLSSTLVTSSSGLLSSTSSSMPRSSSASTSASCSQSTAVPSGIGARAAQGEACPAIERLEYVFVTKQGTPIDVFEDLIKTLPDRGNGARNKAIEPILKSQLYATQLTVEEAAEIRAMDFVESVTRNDPTNDEFAGGIGATIQRPVRHRKRDDHPTANDHFSLERTPSADHLRLLTQVPNLENGRLVMPDKYTFDATLGAGSTIYVLDTGFNSDHADFQNRGSVRQYVVPNMFTLPPNTLRPAPDGTERDPVTQQLLFTPAEAVKDYANFDRTTNEYLGHGTLVASVAGGRVFGVASRADLVLVKWKNGAQTPLNDGQFNSHYTLPGGKVAALQDAFRWIMSDVVATKRQGRAVINFSAGLDPTLFQNTVNVLVQQAWTMGILVVIAAGNGGLDEATLDEREPQNLGTDRNPLITVGGVHFNGQYWPNTTPARPDKAGSMTLYAQSVNVNGASNSGSSSTDTRVDSGCSFAAPAVAGLAAYYWGLQSLSHRWDAPTPQEGLLKMKNFLTETAFPRAPFGTIISSADVDIAHAYSGYPFPDEHTIKVPHNGALLGTCSHPIKRANSSGTVPSDGPSNVSNGTCPVLPESSTTSSISSSSIAPTSSTSSSNANSATSTATLISVSSASQTTPAATTLIPTSATPSSTSSASSDPLFNKKCAFSPNSNCRSYVLITKTGTSSSVFSNFVDKNADVGILGTDADYGDDQMFVTEINSTVVERFRALDFVDVLTPNDGYRGGEFGSNNPSGYRTTKRIQQRADTSSSSSHMIQRTNSSSNLRMLSQDPSQGMQDNYVYSSSGGDGAIIYVIDTGFNFKHVDFGSNPNDLLKRNFRVVSNGFTLPDTNEDDSAPGGGKSGSSDEAAARDYFGLNPDGTYSGHGTCTASLAMGKINGVAPNATLILVKWVQGEKDPAKPKDERAKLPYQLAAARPAALADAFAFAIQDYKTRKQSFGTPNLKAVINFSFGFPISDDDAGAAPGFQPVLRKRVKDAMDAGMTVVIPAGNEGQNGITLNQRTPQVLGSSGNGLITVGAVNSNGSLVPSSTPEKPEAGGSLTLYAQGTEVICASNVLFSETDTQIREGSSFAAAQIAGLAAYFYSTNGPLNNTQTDMKNFLLSKSYQRIADDKIISFPETDLAYSDFVPTKVLVPWNLAHMNQSAGG